jgi:ketosteroid isomerase-like protein
MMEGREAIKNFWKQAVTGMNVSAATLTIVDAEQAGEDVVEIGSAELTLAGGQKVPVKYVVHWKQEGGGWKWHTDIWNLNQ